MSFVSFSSRFDEAAYEVRLAEARLIWWRRCPGWRRLLTLHVGALAWLERALWRRQLAHLRREDEVRRIAFDLPRDEECP